ncbi:hypothetical protein BS17DRAFT_777154, partial [Gyrodon lividus]
MGDNSSSKRVLTPCRARMTLHGLVPLSGYQRRLLMQNARSRASVCRWVISNTGSAHRASKL